MGVFRPQEVKHFLSMYDSNLRLTLFATEVSELTACAFFATVDFSQAIPAIVGELIVEQSVGEGIKRESFGNNNVLSHIASIFQILRSEITKKNSLAFFKKHLCFDHRRNASEVDYFQSKIVEV